MNEFEIIKTYFAKATPSRPEVHYGIGDDAAVIHVPTDHELIVTTDTLVADVHFLASTSPWQIGYKSLAVNLSDLAAMGAAPAWMTLALTLPQIEQSWLQAFCQGFFSLAHQYNVQLVGGDLTKGPLSITVQMLGLTPHQHAVLRSGAQPGDFIYVTGTLGDAGAGLACLQEKIHLDSSIQSTLLTQLHQPTPRIPQGYCLRNRASAAIDISDGLLADLQHLLEASKVGAKVYVEAIPLSKEMKEAFSPEAALNFALAAGDDYELCFTVPLEKQQEIERCLKESDCLYTCIGQIQEKPGLELFYENGKRYHAAFSGYQHF